MSRRDHVPIRTCLGCGARDPQALLQRIVRVQDGSLGVDPERRLGGRGGYLHRRAECWSRFARRKGLVRSLGGAVDRAVRAALVAQLGAVPTSEG